jgi:hypothetical protein
MASSSSTLPYPFQAFGQLEEKDNELIGFGGNNTDNKIIANPNGSIPGIGEINGFDSNSRGLKILVTINNLSNLLAIDKNIADNLFLRVETHDSTYPASFYLTYKLKKSDFVTSPSNNSKNTLFLFYPGLINDGAGFRVCLYYFKGYDNNVACKSGVNAFGPKQEKTELDVPNIVNLDGLISKINDDAGTNNTKTTSMTESNISNYEWIDLRNAYLVSDESNLKFVASINRLILMADDGDGQGNEYLTQIDGSNISNYTEKQISGNGVISIDGFGFNEKNKKIYAFGDYEYQKGNDYDIRYGLAEGYHDHTVFVVDPSTAKIMDSIKLWGGPEEGDETTIGDVFINYGGNELYATALAEGELSEIYVIDANTLKIKSVIPIHDLSDSGYYTGGVFDGTSNVFYMCNSESIIGVNINEKAVVKNISSIYCPTSIDPKFHRGYFVDYPDFSGLIDFNKENNSNYLLLKGGNISGIAINGDVAFAVGHAPNNEDYSCNSNLEKNRSIESYVIKINTTNGKIPTIYKFGNVYIDRLVVNPSNGNLYAKTTELVSDQYSCYENSKLYGLGAMPSK